MIFRRSLLLSIDLQSNSLRAERQTALRAVFCIKKTTGNAGGSKKLFQFTALDLDGDMIVVRADEGAAGIVKVRVGVAGLLDLAAVDAKLLPELMDHAIL